MESEKRRKDAKQVLKIMKEITGEKPAMWGANIVGFGSYDYKYASGREGTFMRIGLSPRKANTSLYIMNDFASYDKLLKKLGKYKTGKSCLYINKLEEAHGQLTMINRSGEQFDIVEGLGIVHWYIQGDTLFYSFVNKRESEQAAKINVASFSLDDFTSTKKVLVENLDVIFLRGFNSFSIHPETLDV